MAVRVVNQRRPPVSLLDLLNARVLGNTNDCVEVLVFGLVELNLGVVEEVKILLVSPIKTQERLIVLHGLVNVMILLFPVHCDRIWNYYLIKLLSFGERPSPSEERLLVAPVQLNCLGAIINRLGVFAQFAEARRPVAE